jgi:pre-mRNA-splicing factor ATP-dependent RNA helicase DHX15/PRP43
VWAGRDEFVKLVEEYQVVILIGETGSGKTTQIPQFLVELGPEKAICCTQPRRVAAMSVAQRVSEEMDVKLGEEVGYSIRFEDVSGPRTRLKYVTDGVLLREAMTDPTLTNYSVIVLDEAHERTVQTDILLGLLKAMLPKRPDMKLIVMSATLEHEKFKTFFPDAPLMKVPGRLHHVDINYSEQASSDYIDAAVQAAVRIHLHEEKGDILMFLPGEEEIEDACARIESHIRLVRHQDSSIPPIRCVPAYSALPPQLLNRIFEEAPPGGRKCVVATNIAETSITIDGIVYVVDPGFSKQKVYNPRTRVESLLVTPISQAACQQRSGRAGRTRPGKCYRLFTKEAFAELVPQTYPEILRTNLGGVVLQMKKLGIDNLVNFDFMDAPAPETLMRALELLNYVGAIDDDGVLTKTGARMSEFPLDPQLARSIIAGQEYGVGSELCCVTAMLSAPRVLLTPRDAKAEAAECHKQFYHPYGDHLMLLHVLQAFIKNGKTQQWARENFLNYRSLVSADNIRSQLEGIINKLNLKTKSYPANDEDYYDRVVMSILTGNFTNVAHCQTKKTFRVIRDNVAVELHPSTCLSRVPEFVTYNEYVYTTRHFIRTVTAVQPQWLVPICPEYFDPALMPEGHTRSVFLKLYREAGIKPQEEE